MKNLKLILNEKKEIIYFIVLLFFSVSINQYYGNLGVCPIDSFWFFNSGFDTLNGYYPFKDYWTIAGPFITFTQALFFKIFGVSWFSYVFHASVFNFLITISTFYTLYKFKLNLHYCFLYSFLISILAYPSAGTPYVDHHASILSVISIFVFILAIKTKSLIFWFFLPIVLAISFFTKQTPTGNIFIIISLFSIYYFAFNFDFRKILCGILGSLSIISLCFILFYLTDISFESFYEQYISFPLTIGKLRVDYFLFPLEFSRIFLRFKLIHLPIFVLMFLIIRKIFNDPKYLKNDDFIIILSLIGFSYVFIAHQLMTLNGMFVFFIIPIIIGFVHIYFLKLYGKKNYFLYIIILIAIFSTAHYANKYIHKRDFMDLRKANFEKTIDAEIIDGKLKGLKWISCYYLDNPKKEIDNLVEAINIIKNDKRKKSILTEYQFISVILSSYDYSPTQVWFMNHVVNEDKDSDFFKSYKKILIRQIVDNNIKVAYLIKPFWADDKIFEKGLNKNCYVKEEITEILTSYTLNDCLDFRS